MPRDKDQQGYLLGIDTGTSKTHALVADLHGNAIGFGESGCGNYEVVGIEGLNEAFNKSTDLALHSAGVKKHQVIGMGFGLSGYDWPSEKELMVQSIEALGISKPYQFVNDVVIGLIAGTTEGWGIAVDAGTGNNVRGRDQKGRIGRITGNSVRFGEFGGAGEMLWQATIAVTYAWTQRGPQTQLTQMMMDCAEVNTEDELIEGLAMDHIHLPPSLARQIFKLAEQGDRVAKQVVTTSAKDLAKNAKAVIRQLELQNDDIEVVLIGSIFKAGEIYLKPFRNTIQAFAPRAKLFQLTVPPVVGSVLLAAETIDLQNPGLRKNLVPSTIKLLSKITSEDKNPTSLDHF